MLKLLKNLTKKEWIFAILCIILIVGQVWLELKIPDYMSEITVLVQTEGSKMQDILLNGGYMVLCALGSLIFAICAGYFVAYIASEFSKNTRKQIFDKVQTIDTEEVKTFQTSSLITRTTNDVTQVEMLLAMGLQLLVKAPITAIWAITKILNKGWQWSIITGIAVLILMIVITILMIIVIPRFKLVQKLIDKINGLARENLTGIRVVRAFNAEKYQEDKFDKVNDDLTGLQLFNQNVIHIKQLVLLCMTR